MFIYCPPKKLEDLKSETINNGRFYTTPDGKKLPSVTTVLGAKGKKAIYEWRQRVGAEEANRISRIASGRGTRMHTLCEKYLNNEELGKPMPDALALFNTIKPYLNRINNIHYQECALWSTRLEMAGRVDCIAEYDGVLSVIDFKTSSRIKTKEDIPAYFAQCVAYALMYEELIGVRIEQLVIIMAVEGGDPIVFVEPMRKHINTLLDYIHFYRKHN
jgi:ATP-dependent exoDNAse (exonuclease V) beta subunit